MYLSLTFLVLLGLILLVISGVGSYMGTALSQDAAIGAGEDILANYHRELYDRYHVFFLDPKEKNYMISDAKAYIDAYTDEDSSYDIQCKEVHFANEISAIAGNGAYLRSQIREYMKYREAGNALAGIESLLSNLDRDSSQALEDRNRIESAEAETEETDGDRYEGDRHEEDPQDYSNWKAFQTTISEIVDKGLLYYCAKDPASLSNAMVEKTGLPTVDHDAGESGSTLEGSLHFSFKDTGEIKDLLGEDVDEKVSLSAVADGAMVIDYAFEHFGYYGKKKKDTALDYELEYLIGTREKDTDNLKYVVNRIFLLRFLGNFAYACQDPEINLKAETVALTVSGLLGLPVAEKLVKYILISALCYGESLLDVRSLLDGKPVPAVKDVSTWNLHFEDAAAKLAAGEPVKTGTANLTYKDYLKLLLLPGIANGKIYDRMMDLMQVNIQQKEPFFLMKDCLYSFQMDAQVEMLTWFQGSGNQKLVQIQRTFSY